MEFVPSETVPRAHTRSRGPRVSDLISHLIYAKYIYTTNTYVCMLSFLNLFFNNCRKKLQNLDLRGCWSPFFLDLLLLLHKAAYIPLSETLAHNVQDPEFFSTSCITRLLRLEFQMFRDFLHYIKY